MTKPHQRFRRDGRHCSRFIALLAQATRQGGVDSIDSRAWDEVRGRENGTQHRARHGTAREESFAKSESTRHDADGRGTRRVDSDPSCHEADSMKPHILAAHALRRTLCGLLLLSGPLHAAVPDPRAVYDFNPGWKLFVGDAPQAATADFDNSGSRSTNVWWTLCAHARAFATPNLPTA